MDKISYNEIIAKFNSGGLESFVGYMAKNYTVEEFEGWWKANIEWYQENQTFQHPHPLSSRM